MCRIATVDIYGMTSFNSTFLKEILHYKGKQEAALNAPFIEETLSAVNCVYKSHLSESVLERDQKEVIGFMGYKRKTHSKLHFQVKEFCKISQRFRVVD